MLCDKNIIEPWSSNLPCDLVVTYGTKDVCAKFCIWDSDIAQVQGAYHPGSHIGTITLVPYHFMLAL